MKKRKTANSRTDDLPDVRKLHIREVDSQDPELDQYSYEWKPSGGGWWKIVKPLR